MSKECIEKCPNIRACYDSANDMIVASGPLPIGVGGAELDDLMKWVGDSYECPGPKLETIIVNKSFPTVRRIFGTETTKKVPSYVCPIEKK